MASITIPKDYFDTLIRRAELHLASDDAITISKAEYNALIQLNSEYQSLRSALLAGGATPETLDILINTPPQLHQPTANLWSTNRTLLGTPATQPFQKCKIRASSLGNWPIDPSPSSGSPDSYGFEDGKSSVTTSDKVEDMVEDTIEDYGGKQETELEQNEFDTNHDDRTLLLKGLSNRTTLADITKAVRGGQLLNLYIRENERTATVSFVNPLAAEAFIIYAKRADLYIRGKRVEVVWAEHQRFMPGHVHRKIVLFNASRNLVIRFPKTDMTAESVREDLEHIHNLHVVDVTKLLAGGHILVSTNDISLAVTARTCMSSRLKYKGSRIEFYPDECCEPLPPIAQKTYQFIPSSPQKKTSNINRFQMLAGMNEEEVDW